MTNNITLTVRVPRSFAIAIINWMWAKRLLTDSQYEKKLHQIDPDMADEVVKNRRALSMQIAKQGGMK